MEQKLVELIKDVLEIQDREILLTTNFKELEGWDSLANLSFIAMIDDEFGVVIDAQRFKHISTLQELLVEIQKI